MNWETINITPERLNGLKLRIAQTIPPTTPPKLLEHILKKEGVGEYSDEEFLEKLSEPEVIQKWVKCQSLQWNIRNLSQ